MNNEQLIGTAFEYAEINNLSATISNSLQKLIGLMSMYERPTHEIETLSKTISILHEYHFTYTSTGLHNFIKLHTK